MYLIYLMVLSTKAKRICQRNVSENSFHIKNSYNIIKTKLLSFP